MSLLRPRQGFIVALLPLIWRRQRGVVGWSMGIMDNLIRMVVRALGLPTRVLIVGKKMSDP